MNLKRRRGFSELPHVQENNIDECYKGLACAIVEQAAVDYRNILYRIDFDLETGVKPSRPTFFGLMEIQRFFKSEWCEFLCGIDGWDILSSLNRQCMTDRAKDWIMAHLW